MVSFSVDADGVGWIVFDDRGARANIVTPAGQNALTAALDALEKLPVRAVVIASAKERVFLVGADLHWMIALATPAEATACSRNGQRLFQRIADFKVPVVAAIHGAGAGGGYELALACTWRIASDAAATVVGLPETGFGAIPGWGGGVRLTRLIGARAAVEHVVKAVLVPAAEALRAGLVDEVVPAAEWISRAQAAALRLATAGAPVRKVAPDADAAFFAEAKAAALRKSRGREPAAWHAIDVIERGAGRSVAEALEIEAEVFGEVMTSEVFRNLTHVFFLKEGVKKLTVDAWFPGAAAGTAAPFKRIGVVGAGVMGSGIAQWCAARGHEVVMRDVKPEFVARGLEVIKGVFDEAVARQRMSAADAAAGLARLRGTTTWEGFAECDLVIEAVVENVAAKQALFKELAGVVRPDCVLASNTSALPIEEIMAGVAGPERTMGIHFFNPVSRMPLVELVLSPHTARATAERTLAFVKGLGKSPVICRSSPGFLVTRVLFFYLNEACRLWEQGVPAETLDAAMREWGWPMGPARLIDEVGVDVTDFIFGEMAHYFPARFTATTVCGRMLAAGLKGRKNGAGAGFYTYAGKTETVNSAVAVLVPERGAAQAGMGAAEIAARLMGVMTGEAQRCLDEGVLKTADEVNLAMLLGTGFPAFRGGLLKK